MKKYGVVLIGCGATSKRYLEAIKSLGHKLVAVVDIVPERAKKRKEEFGVEEWGTDYRIFLKREDIKIIVITTWPSTHAKIAIDSMKAGKDVLCEKPITKTLEEARKVIEIVKETKRKMVIGYILRYNESYQKIAKMIKESRIGFPIIMRMAGAEHIIAQIHWERHQALLRDTSPLIDCGSHYVDVMRWFSGEEVISVSGIGARVEEETPKDKYDWGKILTKLSKGSVGSYEVGWGHNFRNYSEKEFIGPRGRIRLIYAHDRFEHHEEGDLIEYYSYPGQYEIINIKGEYKPTGKQFQYLIDHIERNEDCLPILENAYKSLQIVLAGDEAIRKDKTIYLE